MKDEGHSFEELVTRARAAYHAKNDAEQDDIYWDIVWLLAIRGDQTTFDTLLPLTSGDSFERSFSVSVLGRFDPAPVSDEPAFEAETERFASGEIIDLLLERLETETDEEVLESLVSSLGQHQESDERIPLALGRFLNHPNPNIRWLLAAGMGSYDTPEAVEMLIVLSSDDEIKVRDWATFGLGSLNSLDSTEIREALAARLEDEDPETRIEAIEGLALRHDPGVVPIVLREFDDHQEPKQPFLPTESLLTALREMGQVRNYSGDKAVLSAAIKRCEALLAQASQHRAW